jgi:hypothetical protein
VQLERLELWDCYRAQLNWHRLNRPYHDWTNQLGSQPLQVVPVLRLGVYSLKTFEPFKDNGTGRKAPVPLNYTGKTVLRHATATTDVLGRQ